jgi:hypothetical protein
MYMCWTNERKYDSVFYEVSSSHRHEGLKTLRFPCGENLNLATHLQMFHIVVKIVGSQPFILRGRFFSFGSDVAGVFGFPDAGEMKIPSSLSYRIISARPSTQETSREGRG